MIHQPRKDIPENHPLRSLFRTLTERGFIFVSTNYRLLPEVKIEELLGDVARSVGWVHKNIGRYGGDPTRIFVGGHSAGAQLAA